MSKRPLSPSRDEPTAKCARMEDALTWDTLLVELRKLIQCYLHKRDKLSLARTSKLNWRERSNVEAAWTVNDALHAWHQSNMPRPTVDTGVAVAAFSFAAFCLRQSLTKPPWHIIYKNDPTLYTFMDSVYLPNKEQLIQVRTIRLSVDRKSKPFHFDRELARDSIYVYPQNQD